VVAGAKLIVVLGHTSCGAVTSAIQLMQKGQTAEQATGCENLGALIEEIQDSLDPHSVGGPDQTPSPEMVDAAACRNVVRTMRVVLDRSRTLRRLVEQGQVAIVGGLYDIRTGQVSFFAAEGVDLDAGLDDASARVRERLASAAGALEGSTAAE
jgi:carbonic anhydrase/SulP family sulfate permease